MDTKLDRKKTNLAITVPWRQPEKKLLQGTTRGL